MYKTYALPKRRRKKEKMEGSRFETLKERARNWNVETRSQIVQLQNLGLRIISLINLPAGTLMRMTLPRAPSALPTGQTLLSEHHMSQLLPPQAGAYQLAPGHTAKCNEARSRTQVVPAADFLKLASSLPAPRETKQRFHTEKPQALLQDSYSLK